jgi:hypothetical protein
MAVVKGVKEKVHLPVFDSVSVKPGKRLGDILTSNVMRFFQDVTGKTKLQTNMQAASLLPHWNTYEARALRVVISDLPPQFPNDVVIDAVLDKVDSLPPPTFAFDGSVTVHNFTLSHFAMFKRRVEGPRGEPVRLTQAELEDLALTTDAKLDDGHRYEINPAKLRLAAEQFRRDVLPTNEQIFPHDGFGTVIGKFIYNTVTTFFVGEKIMIQVPTYFFPAGAGPYSEDGRVTTHGYPNPQATFRFAEPVTIDAQQNFRVEIEVPESDVLSELQRLYGPLVIWTVIDGYMTRDVQ